MPAAVITLDTIHVQSIGIAPGTPNTIFVNYLVSNATNTVQSLNRTGVAIPLNAAQQTQLDNIVTAITNFAKSQEGLP